MTIRPFTACTLVCLLVFSESLAAQKKAGYSVYPPQARQVDEPAVAAPVAATTAVSAAALVTPPAVNAPDASGKYKLHEGEDVFRSYFTTHRGVEALGSTWTFLDLTPLGRQEEWEDSPAGYPQTKPYQWWRRHDEYEDTPAEPAG